MSYEGYNIYLCVSGHRNDYDALSIIYGCEDPKNCEDCGAVIAWWYGVDETNDSGVEPALKIHKPTETETCEYCGHTKQSSEEQYEIPSNTGQLLVTKDELLVPLETVKFRDNDSGELFDTKNEAWKKKGYRL